MNLIFVLGAHFGQTVGWGFIEHPVSFAVLHSSDLGFFSGSEVILDYIWITIRLSLLAPHLEVWIAHQRHALVGVIG